MKRRYDAILLLGVELGSGDRPTQEMHARAKAAAFQYAAGAAPVIVACGGTLQGHAVSEAEVMAGLLTALGVPGESILLESRSQNTMGNMRFARALLGGRRRVLVVTSDYHVCRAVMTARRAGFAAHGCGAALEHDEGWRALRGRELAYTLDLLMGWQDEGKSRPQWTYALFERVFGRR